MPEARKHAVIIHLAGGQASARSIKDTDSSVWQSHGENWVYLCFIECVCSYIWLTELMCVSFYVSEQKLSEHW